ncbi:MAG: MFS transporter [Anaerolineae bacterium]
MKRELRGIDYITINLYWLGLNVASATLTPVLLPYLVAFFAPPELKNTYLATLRVIGLAVAMAVQPIAGLLSDRCTHPLGRRRPFIIGGALCNVLFLAILGASPSLVNSPLDPFFQALVGATTAYVALVIGNGLLQASSNMAHGALQGLIPDRVPEHQRGRASGVKAVMELLPAFLVILIGPLVDAGQIWLTVGILMASFLITMGITVLTVHEEPLAEKPTGGLRGPILRLIALAAIFVGTSQLAVWGVRSSSQWLAQQEATVGVQVFLVGLAGLLGMAGSIFIGVYLGAWVGIGREARQQTSFIWWVINRLLFLAAVGSIQGFAQYYLRDVLHIPNAATMTTVLLGVVAVFLVITALGGGYLADRIGRKRLVVLAGLVAALGTGLLLLARDIPLVIVGGSVIGIGAGTFMATNWALGTDLAPSREAGRYLGISNLAGAGAGIVGAGIGGPMADFFNALRPGLGYLVIFSLYGLLFLLSVVTLTQVKQSRAPTGLR